MIGRRTVTKPYKIIKSTPGVYLGALTSGRKVYTFAKSQEDAVVRILSTLKFNENIKSVYHVNDLES